MNLELHFQDREEAELVYNQLSARKTHFEKLMVDAGKANNAKGVMNFAKQIERLNSIMNRMLSN